jgi:hypothetical protein
VGDAKSHATRELLARIAGTPDEAPRSGQPGRDQAPR